MKHLLAALVILVATSVTVTSQRQVVKSHDISIKGMQVRNGARGTLTLVGKSEGSLPGSFEMSVWYNPATRQITGGTWKLAISQPGRERSSKLQAALAGSIKGGTVSFDKQGRVERAEGIRLTVGRGAGSYSRVVRGAGDFRGTLDLRRQHPFMGELHISF